jgi:hypothetical protein
VSLPLWSPARFASRRRGSSDFRRRRPLFGSGSSLSSSWVKDIFLISGDKLFRLVFGLDPPSPTIFRVGSTQIHTGQSSWYCSSLFRVNPTRSALRPGSSHNRTSLVKFIPVQCVPDPVRCSRCFRPGSECFRPGSACFRPVQLVSDRFSSLLLDPGLIVLFFVHFTHFIGCVVVSLGLVGIVDPLCGRFDTI